MEIVYMPLQWAPTSLNQPILPNWSFNLFNVNLGSSANAAVEQEALEKVGSYGRQIGHIAEALEVIVGKQPPRRQWTVAAGKGRPAGLPW